MNKINELKPGDEGVVIEALINRVVVGKTNGANRSTYLSITLQDATGTIDAKLWNATNEQVEKLVMGCVVQVKGDVIKYNEDRQMKIIKIVVASTEPQEQVKFLKSAPQTGEELVKEIYTFIERINNLKLNQLVKALFNEHVEKLTIYPAASKNHHEYVSGLAYHTCSMLRIADALARLYPSLNRDLLFAGITLHDLGKTVELSGPVVPEYTIEGKLLGHIMNIEGEEVTLLQHIILSHHGKNEFGSPILPQIKEAEVIYLIDNMDARINMLDKALETVEPGGFSKRVFALENRAFYKPKMN